MCEVWEFVSLVQGKNVGVPLIEVMLTCDEAFFTEKKEGDLFPRGKEK